MPGRRSGVLAPTSLEGTSRHKHLTTINFSTMKNLLLWIYIVCFLIVLMSGYILAQQSYQHPSVCVQNNIVNDMGGSCFAKKTLQQSYLTWSGVSNYCVMGLTQALPGPGSNTGGNGYGYPATGSVQLYGAHMGTVITQWGHQGWVACSNDYVHGRWSYTLGTGFTINNNAWGISTGSSVQDYHINFNSSICCFNN